MSEQTYTIKPLEWKPSYIKAGVMIRVEALTPFGYLFAREDGWYSKDTLWEYSDSMEAAKIAAEAHYRIRLSAALAPTQKATVEG